MYKSIRFHPTSTFKVCLPGQTQRGCGIPVAVQPCRVRWESGCPERLLSASREEGCSCKDLWLSLPALHPATSLWVHCLPCIWPVLARTGFYTRIPPWLLFSNVLGSLTCLLTSSASISRTISARIYYTLPKSSWRSQHIEILALLSIYFCI